MLNYHHRTLNVYISAIERERERKRVREDNKGQQSMLCGDSVDEESSLNKSFTGKI